MGTQPRCVHTPVMREGRGQLAGSCDGEDGGEGGVWECEPSIMSHSGFCTRSESGCGSRSASHFVSSASLISSGVRWRMKTGLPRHLMITWSREISTVALRRVAETEENAYVLALGDSGQVDLDLRLREDVCGCGHID